MTCLFCSRNERQDNRVYEDTLICSSCVQKILALTDEQLTGEIARARTQGYVEAVKCLVRYQGGKREKKERLHKGTRIILKEDNKRFDAFKERYSRQQESKENEGDVIEKAAVG